MIKLHKVTKSYTVNGFRKQIFKDFSFEFTKDKNYALLGVNGAGKSTLLRMLSGVEQANSGFISRAGKVSWPMAFSGGFNGSMTGIENVKFVSRIYGQDSEEVIKYVVDFSELGESFYLPIKTYSSGMRARLAFGLSLAIDFDCYLIDEVIAVGDSSFQKKSKDAFKQKFSKSFLIMASHSLAIVRDYCDCGLLLVDNNVQYYSDVDSLIAAYLKVSI